MTTLVTLSSKDGIVMAADSRVTTVDLNTRRILDTHDDLEKIMRVGVGTGVSYWGQITLAGHRVDRHIERAVGTIGSEATPDVVAKALRDYFTAISPPIRNEFGIHVAGYEMSRDGSKVPRIRHVFHTAPWPAGRIVNESSNLEYHNGSVRVSLGAYDPHIALFNGVNAIPNLLFLAMPQIIRSEIRLDVLALEETIELAEAMVDMTKATLRFYFRGGPTPQRIPQLTGGKTVVAALTRTTGFRWIRRLMEA